MRPDQWEMLQKCASGADLDSLPVALIVDSPWIPGYLQMSTLDYLTLPDVWLQANLRVLQDFPEIIFIPGFWIEYGMAAEPSGFGCRVSTLGDKTPLVQTLGADFQLVEQLKVPDPRTDGLMPVLLNWYRHAQPRIEDAGYSDVSGLTKNANGVWTGAAKKGGQSVTVKVDFQGNVTQ